MENCPITILPQMTAKVNMKLNILTLRLKTHLLQQMLENPIATIRSVTNPNRVVALLKATHNGNQIVVPVEVNGYGRLNNVTIDSNAITSSLGKNNAVKQLYDAVLGATVGTSNDLFYWNKNEALSLLRRAGHQLSGGSPQDGLVYSIRDKNAGVNLKFKNITETKQYKDFFGDWQNNPKKASKDLRKDLKASKLYISPDEAQDIPDFGVLRRG